MSNIIMNDDLTIRTTQFDANSIYSLYDINFYIPTALSTYKTFAIIEDNAGLYDICELAFEKNSSNYCVYKFTQGQCLRIKTGNCRVTIMLINTNGFQDSKVSKSVEVNLNIDLYKMSHRLYITQQLSEEIAQCYKDNLKILDMMIDVYENFQEMVGDKQ